MLRPYSSLQRPRPPVTTEPAHPTSENDKRPGSLPSAVVSTVLYRLLPSSPAFSVRLHFLRERTRHRARYGLGRRRRRLEPLRRLDLDVVVPIDAGPRRDEMADDDVLLSPSKSSRAPRIAASVNTRVVSWNEAAEMNDCVVRSEEHTSELQSQSNLACRLLLEKKHATSHSSSPARLRASTRPARITMPS